MALFPTLYFSIQNTLYFSLSTGPIKHHTNTAADLMGLWTDASVYPFKPSVFNHGCYPQRKPTAASGGKRSVKGEEKLPGAFPPTPHLPKALVLCGQ